MDIAIWVVQGLLALAFGMAGFGKLTQPYDKLKAQMGYVEDLSPTTVKVIGGLELSGALGLILPAVTGILPWLTPLAAIGLALTMVGAVLLHVRRTEYNLLIINFTLMALAAIVIYGRIVAEPLS